MRADATDRLRPKLAPARSPLPAVLPSLAECGSDGGARSKTSAPDAATFSGANEQLILQIRSLAGWLEREAARDSTDGLPSWVSRPVSGRKISGQPLDGLGFKASPLKKGAADTTHHHQGLRHRHHRQAEDNLNRALLQVSRAIAAELAKAGEMKGAFMALQTGRPTAERLFGDGSNWWTKDLSAQALIRKDWRDQPRVPAGQEDGGQWTDGGGSGAGVGAGASDGSGRPQRSSRGTTGDRRRDNPNRGLSREERELLTDIAVLGLDIAGVLDPTPASDAISGLISASRGNYFEALISLTAIVPYVGDIAKVGKLGKFAQIVDRAARLVEAGKAKTVPKVRSAMEVLRNQLKTLVKAEVPGPVGRSLETMKTRLDEMFLNDLKNQGHGPQRHEGEVTDKQLIERVLTGKRPEGGYDNYIHKVATRVKNESDYVDAEQYIRHSAAFQHTKIKFNEQKNRYQKKIRVPLSEVLGSDYLDKVEGFTRLGSQKNPQGSEPTDMTNFDMVAVYVLDKNDQFNLLTMYPTKPKNQLGLKMDIDSDEEVFIQFFGIFLNPDTTDIEAMKSSLEYSKEDYKAFFAYADKIIAERSMTDDYYEFLTCGGGAGSDEEAHNILVYIVQYLRGEISEFDYNRMSGL